MTYKPPFYKQPLHSIRRLLAYYWLSFQPAIKIGITGSQGKTNTTRLIAHLLSTIGPTTSTDTDLDSTYNIPITALKVTPWTKFAVFELGIDHPGEMDKLLEIVKPQIAIITGISPVHTDKEHLGSLENLIKEKRKLVEALPNDAFAILNYDEESIRKMAPYTKAKILWFGTDPKNCDVYVDPKTIKLSLDGTKFELNIKTDQHLTPTIISTKLIGRHNIYSVSAVICVILTLQKILNIKVSIKRLINIIEEIKPLHGRMSVEEGPLGYVILNDSLRANPSSTASGLKTLSEIEYSGRKIAVLAEMGELQHPEEEHKKIGAMIPNLKIGLVITIGPLQKFVYNQAIKTGFPQNKIYWFINIIDASEFLKKNLNKSDLIYLKGSLLRHLERLLILLRGAKVKCDVIICPFYNDCSICKYRFSGYQNAPEK